MSDDPTAPEAPKTPTEVLAALVAKRKAAAGGGTAPGKGDQRSAQRAEAARAAAKSKPALRK